MSNFKHRILLIGAMCLLPYANVGCGVECGDGTTESDGECVPADGSLDPLICGPGTMLIDGLCQAAVETGGDTCATSTIECNAAAGKVSICGQLIDTETQEPLWTDGTTTATCLGPKSTADGPCSFTVLGIDVVTQQPLVAEGALGANGIATVDHCGRFKIENFDPGFAPFAGITVFDGALDTQDPTQPGFFGVNIANTQAIVSAAAGPNPGGVVQVTSMATATQWSIDLGLCDFGGTPQVCDDFDPTDGAADLPLWQIGAVVMGFSDVLSPLGPGYPIPGVVPVAPAPSPGIDLDGDMMLNTIGVDLICAVLDGAAQAGAPEGVDVTGLFTATAFGFFADDYAGAKRTYSFATPNTPAVPTAPYGLQTGTTGPNGAAIVFARCGAGIPGPIDPVNPLPTELWTGASGLTNQDYDRTHPAVQGVLSANPADWTAGQCIWQPAPNQLTPGIISTTERIVVDALSSLEGLTVPCALP